MLFDLHCHTRRIKDGDAGREVSAETFKTKILGAKVNVVAITNHDYFDLTQYKNFCNELKDSCSIWPGVEMDVSGDKSGQSVKGHVLVITHPRNKQKLYDIINGLNITDYETYSLNIDLLAKTFEGLGGCLFIFHYKKDPQLTKEDIDFFKKNMSSDDIVVLEPSNARKTGLILYENNEACWFGSDVKDWDNYPFKDNNKQLPNCLFDIKDFDDFKCLLAKDNSAILLNTYFSPKYYDPIQLNVFDDLNLDLKLFKDVNVIFGGKETGKTVILEKYKEYFENENLKVHSYFIEKKKDEIKKMVDVKPDKDILDEINKYSCELDFNFLKSWSWPTSSTLNSFYAYEDECFKNKIVTKYKIIKSSFSDVVDDAEYRKSKANYFDNKGNLEDMLSLDYPSNITQEEINFFKNIIKKIIDGLYADYIHEAIVYYSLCLEKKSIEFLKKKFSIELKTPIKPTSIGFSDFYSSFKILKDHVERMQSNYKKVFDTNPVEIGSVPNKGPVYRHMKIGFISQETLSAEINSVTGGGREYLNSNITDTMNKKFSTILNKIKFKDKSENITASVSEFNSFISDHKITSLNDLINYSNFLELLSNHNYKPSNGIQSILLVDAAVKDRDAQVIILDEPDGGMGADFINEVLIPQINKRASENKIILLATHDPNLVIRTHPYLCLYREEISNNKYETYKGSFFEEYMENLDDESNKIKFVDACINKCEGGHDALKERTRVYGRQDDN